MIAVTTESLDLKKNKTFPDEGLDVIQSPIVQMYLYGKDLSKC